MPNAVPPEPGGGGPRRGRVTLGELAGQVLRRDLTAFLGQRQAILAEGDPASVHDLRVTTRRLRAALDAFADALPDQVVGLRPELGWLGSELGVVRDLDVHLDGVLRWRRVLPAADGPGLAEVADLLVRERVGALRRLAGALESERCAALVRELQAAAGPDDGPPGPAAQADALRTVPARVEEAHRAARSVARRARRRGSPRDFHRLRIRSKELRYTIELVTDLYPTTAPPAAAGVASIQGRLGRLQDDVALGERFRALAVSERAGLSPGALLAMGAVAERLRRRTGRRLRRMPARLGALHGRAWRALRADMRRGSRDGSAGRS